MSRSSQFSFRCNRCSRCCFNKTIKVNPYEVARLAANLGLDSTAFISNYTVSQGTALKKKDDGSCIFLGAEGCSVHPDRPFVCRLYPLMRRTDKKGIETFATVKLHPQCEGEFGSDDTVAGYLTGQQAEEYIAAVDAYLDLTKKILLALEEAATRESRAGGDGPQGTPDGFDPDEVEHWLDMDHTLRAHGYDDEQLKANIVADKMREHISHIESRLASIKGKG